MPYRRHEPVSEAEMDRKRYDGDNTLCQTLRDMYHLTTDPVIMLKCRLAFSMSKAMCKRLTAYKEKYGIQQPEYQDGI